MKKIYTLLLLSLFLINVSLAQDLSKEDKKMLKTSRKEKERIGWKIKEFDKEVRDGSGKLLFTNDSIEIIFKGKNNNYQDKFLIIEKYTKGALFPLKNIRKTTEEVPGFLKFENHIFYFPKIFVNYNHIDKKIHGYQKFIVPEKASLKDIYNYETEKNNLLVLEFFDETNPVLADRYSYGAILETDLIHLNERLSKKEIGLIIDGRDNKTYKWAQIGNQKWFIENLAFQLPIYSDSYIAELESKVDNIDPPGLGNYSDKKMKMYKRLKYLESTASNTKGTKYTGSYYNFYDALESCPNGWHIPSDNEWKELEKYIGMNEDFLNTLGKFSRMGENSSPGKILVNNKELMFDGRYAGSLTYKNGYFSVIGKNENGNWWTSSKIDILDGIIRVVGTKFDGIVRDKVGVHNYLNCRCVENEDMETIIKKAPKLAELTEKINSDPTIANNYFNRAIEFITLGENQYAIDDVSKAMQINSTEKDFMLLKAQLLYLQNYAKYEQEINELVDAFLLTDKGNSFALHFDTKLALYTWDTDRNGQKKLAITNSTAQVDQALRSITKAINLDPKNIEFLKLKSDLLIKINDYSNAIAILKKALIYDSKNPELLKSMAMSKLRYYHQYNTKNNIRADKWCTMIGACYKITPKQITLVCNYFKKVINYGGNISPDYYSLCGQLRQAELHEQHKPIIHTGPRGGRYTISSSGNKVYIPKSK